MKTSIPFFVILLGIVLNIQAQIPTNGLVGYWPFNGNANDESGNGNNGVVHGATLTNDRFGNANNAYSFNGVNNYIRVSDNSSLDISDEITISAWRYLSSNSMGRIVRKIETWNSVTGGYILSSANDYINTELKLNSQSGVKIIRKDSTFSLNQWEFVAMTYDGTQVNLYLNDKLYYSSQITGKIQVNDEDLIIGASDGGVEYFAGSIDDIRIYNRALDVNEIRALFYESCNNSFHSITETACDSYISPSGNYTWTASGIYNDTIPNAAGCDSVITINLTINAVDTSVTQNGIMLTANQTGATYQWLDCSNDYAEIIGETNQSFTAPQNGNYAVKVTQNNCVDTSACYTVSTVGIVENSFNHDITVYPNPTSGKVTIDLGYNYNDINLTIQSLDGKKIKQTRHKNQQTIEMNLDISEGFYFIIVESENQKAILKIIKY